MRLLTLLTCLNTAFKTLARDIKGGNGRSVEIGKVFKLFLFADSILTPKRSKQFYWKTSTNNKQISQCGRYKINMHK